MGWLAYLFVFARETLVVAKARSVIGLFEGGGLVVCVFSPRRELEACDADDDAERDEGGAEESWV